MVMVGKATDLTVMISGKICTLPVDYLYRRCSECQIIDMRSEEELVIKRVEDVYLMRLDLNIPWERWKHLFISGDADLLGWNDSYYRVEALPKGTQLKSSTGMAVVSAKKKREWTQFAYQCNASTFGSVLGRA